MPLEFSYETQYSVGTDVIAQMFRDEAFYATTYDEFAERADFKEPYTLEVASTDSTITMKSDAKVPAAAFSEKISPFFGKTLHLHWDNEWNVYVDGSISGKMTLEINETKITLEQKVMITSSPQGADRKDDCVATCNIPLIGNMIEKVVAENAGRALAKQIEIANEYARTHPQEGN